MKNAHEKLVDYDLVSNSTDKNFGLAMSFVMLILAVTTKKYLFLIVAVAFLSLAVVAPSMLKSANQLWTKFGTVLHKIMTPVIMLLVYAVVFVPFGYLLKICGKNTMLRYKESKASYWINKEPCSIANPMKYQF